MGQVFTMPAATRSLITTVFDDLFVEFGKPCRFVYPPERRPCGSCGGPGTGFEAPSCVACSGTGFAEVERSEIVTMLLAWEPKAFWRPVPSLDVVVPGGLCQAKLFLADVPRLLRAAAVVLQTPIEPLLKATYVLEGEPFDPSNIIQGRYAIANLRRRD